MFLFFVFVFCFLCFTFGYFVSESRSIEFITDVNGRLRERERERERERNPTWSSPCSAFIFPIRTNTSSRGINFVCLISLFIENNGPQRKRISLSLADHCRNLRNRFQIIWSELSRFYWVFTGFFLPSCLEKNPFVVGSRINF